MTNRNAELPDAPKPKPATAAPNSDAAADPDSAVESSSRPDVMPAGDAGMMLTVAPKPAADGWSESRTNRIAWYSLAAVGHSAAVFDAWSTRRAINSGYATEANPLLRPFANSGAMYAATQVSPLVMDFLGRRMMRSRHSVLRKTWWLPQTIGAAASLTAGAHNLTLVP